jgi:hypothetical protein
VDILPNPLLLRKPGRAEKGKQDLWIYIRDL